MLRITQVQEGTAELTLRVEGRVMGPWVGLLRQACEPLLRAGTGLRLDLAGVNYVDREGVAWFLTVRGQGVLLAGCRPFVEEQLRVGEKR